jgi:hypothetical protein
MERLIANLTVAREKRLADLEAITAMDLSHGAPDSRGISVRQ